MIPLRCSLNGGYHVSVTSSDVVSTTVTLRGGVLGTAEKYTDHCSAQKYHDLRSTKGTQNASGSTEYKALSVYFSNYSIEDS